LREYYVRRVTRIEPPYVIHLAFLLVILLPWMILFCCLAAFRGVLTAKFLGHPWITTIGGMCYTIYMYHWLMLCRAWTDCHAGTLNLKNFELPDDEFGTFPNFFTNPVILRQKTTADKCVANTCVANTPPAQGLKGRISPDTTIRIAAPNAPRDWDCAGAQKPPGRR
jgi:hypothetical protein